MIIARKAIQHLIGTSIIVLDDPRQEIVEPQLQFDDNPQSRRYARALLLREIIARLIEQREMSGSMVELNRKISEAEGKIARSQNTLHQALWFNNLAVCIGSRAEATNSIEDAVASVQKIRTALQLLSKVPCPDAQYQTEFSFTLGQRLRAQHQILPAQSTIDEAVQYINSAIERSTPDPAHRDRKPYYLGLALRDLYLVTRQPAHLERSVMVIQDIINHSEKTDPYWVKSKILLGWILLDRFNEQEYPEDISRAITIGQELGQVVSEENEVQHVGMLALQGHAFYKDYLQNASSESLQTSITYRRKALDLTSVESSLHAQNSNSLAVSLKDYYSSTGSKESLLEGIRLLEKALGTVESKGLLRLPIYPRLLHNLSEAFRARYLADGELQDLKRAIELSNLAAGTYLQDSIEKLESENSLAANLRERYNRLHAEDDYHSALSRAMYNVEHCERHHPNFAIYYSNLAAILGDRVQHAVRSKELDPRTWQILDEAINARKLVVQKTSENNVNRPHYLINLADMYLLRYREKKDDRDLDDSIENARASVHGTDERHSARARRMRTLGDGYQERYHKSLSQRDFDEASQCYTMSLSDKNSPPLERIIAGQKAANMAMTIGSWDEAVGYLEICHGLLPKIILRSSSYNDQLFQLKKIKMLGVISASIFIKAGRPAAEALQALEKCRSTMSSLVVNLRSEVPFLKEQNPQLHEKYCRLRAAVAETYFHQANESAGLALVKPSTMASRASQNEKNVEELERVENDIRMQPGFERFQLAPSGNEIMELAQYGPLVSFNITEYASHALIATNKNIQALELPRITQADVAGFIFSMRRDLRPDTCASGGLRNAKILFEDHGEGAAESELPEISQEKTLHLLWEYCVRPVLEVLGFLGDRQIPNEHLPEIWWVGGGLMSLLPLHAAGDYQDNAMKHVVSSYSVSLKTLCSLRKKQWQPLKAEQTNILVVDMPQTENQPDLETKEEVATIEKHVGSSAKIKHLRLPTRDKVLGHLQTCSIAHFACHGRVNSQYPDQSALILGNEKAESLTVQDLQPMNHQLAQLAYLSACSTAQSPTSLIRKGDRLYLEGFHLVDEGSRLADTFQMAGFRHVVGSLWSVGDLAAVAVAGNFYDELIKNGESKSAVSRALHAAVLHRRLKNGSDLDWIPFIHAGP